jgi:hypothetical protein
LTLASVRAEMPTMRTCISTALVALLLGACTAAKASLQIVNAEQALTRAETQGSEDAAAYEYTMAKLYLDKAQEEAGYSEFRIADALARQSAEWSDRAVIFMEKRGRTDMNLDDFVLPEAPTTSDVPKPAPPAPNEDWLNESNPNTIPGGEATEPEPEPTPEPEPDPFAIEEKADEIEIGTPKAPTPDDAGVEK